MSFLTVNWRASNVLRQGEVVETGRAGSVERKFLVSMDDQSREWREQVTRLLKIDDSGNYTADLSGEWTEVERGVYASGDRDYASGLNRNPLLLDAQPTAAELPALIKRVADSDARRRRIGEEKTMATRAEEAAAMARRDAESKARAARNAEANRIRAEKDERGAAEKARWIAAHGSDHLKRAFAAGYNSQRPYVLERAAAEWPGWVVDFNDTAQWNERSFPSTEALDAADAAGALVEDAAEVHDYGEPRVVWLTAEPSNAIRDDDDDDYGDTEAVIVSGFIGKYNLFKIL